MRTLTVILAIASGWAVTSFAGGWALAVGAEPNATGVLWRIDNPPSEARIVAHETAAGQSRRGGWCEHLRLFSGGRAPVSLTYSTEPAAIIPELTPSVWVRSDRASVQLCAQIVLPRSIDPSTGRAVTVTVSGPVYTQHGRWQQLRLTRLPLLLEREVRLRRTLESFPLTTNEARLTQLVLRVETGLAAADIWIDEVETPGLVVPSQAIRLASGEMGVEPIDAPAGDARADLAGSVLQVGGRPIFPRIVDYHGESLAWLRERGFNAVAVQGEIPAPLVVEARQEGMFVVGAPPAPDEIQSPGHSIDLAANDRVLAWMLGEHVSVRDLETIGRWADVTRRADRPQPRPIAAAADSGLRPLSRHVDLLVVERNPIGTTCELDEYAEWIRARGRIARPGTPLWVRIETEYPVELANQPSIAPYSSGVGAVPSEQLALVTHAALSAGARGLWFRSNTRLDDESPESRERAMNLELINRQLEIVEPFLSAGSYLGTLDSSDPEVKGAMLRTDRARILFPMWTGKGAQFVPGQSAASTISFIVPGVPETHDAFEISPMGLKPLRRRRVTGGMAVTLEEFNVTSCVLFTQDPLAIAAMTNRARARTPAIAALARDLAVAKLQKAMTVDQTLASLGQAVPDAPQRIAAAQASLRAAETLLPTGDHGGVWIHAHRSMRSLRMLERTHWERGVANMPSPITSPWAFSFATLPDHWALSAQLAGQRPIGNRLPGGDFEDPAAMTRAGWRHMQHTQPGVVATADWVLESPHSGRRSLCLKVDAENPDAPPALVESPPVWITSPAVRVQPGQCVRIQGWVRVPLGVQGSVDGLIISDSATRGVLAERVLKADEWRLFTHYRIAPPSGLISVTFALSGLGTAFIDDVTIEPLSAPGVEPFPAPPARDFSAPPSDFAPPPGVETLPAPFISTGGRAAP